MKRRNEQLERRPSGQQQKRQGAKLKGKPNVIE